MNRAEVLQEVRLMKFDDLYSIFGHGDKVNDRITGLKRFKRLIPASQHS